MYESETHLFAPLLCPGAQEKQAGTITGISPQFRGWEKNELSTKTYVDPGKWNAGKGRVKGTNEESRRLNNQIEAFEFRARELYNHFLEKGRVITPELIKSEMTGLEHKKRTLVHSFEQFVQEIELKIGNEYAAGTVKNWKVTQGHLKEFLERSYGIMDIPFKSLSLQFLTDFDFYARTTWNCRTNAVMKHIQRIRKIVNKPITSDWLDKDPFASYEGKQEKTNRTFLTEEELKAVERKKIRMDRLERVRDVFVFSCYTGLSYADVEQLTEDHLVTGIDGKKWIYTFRQKSDGKSNVPLLPRALSIIEKYRSDPNCKRSGRLLPVITNIKTNEYLKKIADICGIKKNLTFHMARHTFATTVTLTNGVPIETVSNMLGHTKITTTQIYAKVMENKVSDDMHTLENKLANAN